MTGNNVYSPDMLLASRRTHHDRSSPAIENLKSRSRLSVRERKRIGLALTARADLNLFRAFNAIMRHRNLAAAGRELGISASAVSHAVTRMRVMLKDELFVAGSRSMLPTSRALQLSSKIAVALSALDGLVSAEGFDAAASRRVFRIAVTDHVSTLLLPILIPCVIRQAPGIKVHILPIVSDVARQLAEGGLDLVLGSVGRTAAQFRRKPLFTEREALVARRGHPLTLDADAASLLPSFPRLFVDVMGCAGLGVGERDGSAVRHEVRERDALVAGDAGALVQPTSVSVPCFALAVALVKSTNLIASVPERLLAQSSDIDGLARINLPFRPSETTIDVVWHGREDRDAALRWFIGEAVRASTSFSSLPEPQVPSRQHDS